MKVLTIIGTALFVLWVMSEFITGSQNYGKPCIDDGSVDAAKWCINGKRTG
jgi:hypothetical protein